jgi:hypothetical protein
MIQSYDLPLSPTTVSLNGLLMELNEETISTNDEILTWRFGSGSESTSPYRFRRYKTVFVFVGGGEE